MVVIHVYYSQNINCQLISIISSANSNLNAYIDYYDKPGWWFSLRYDTQVKLKTILHLFKNSNISLTNKVVCELGFGSGKTLFKFDKSSSLFGVEISESAIRKAAKKAAKKGYNKFSFSKLNDNGVLPLDDKTADIIIASHVIEHITDENGIVNEINRVLKDGGVATILIPINERYEDPKHVKKYTSASCKELFQKHGFQLVFSLENELLAYLVESIYQKNKINQDESKINYFFRIFFNVSTAWLPYRVYMMADTIIHYFTRLPPRQAGLIFKKV